MEINDENLFLCFKYCKLLKTRYEQHLKTFGITLILEITNLILENNTWLNGGQ